MIKWQTTAIAAFTICCISIFSVQAELTTQNFDDFAQTSPPNAPPTVTTNGWTINGIHITSIPFPALSGDNPAFFPDQRDSGVSGTNSFVTSPLLTNGVGDVSFYLRNWDGGGPYELQIQVSTDDGVTWETQQTITDSVAGSWTQYTLSIDNYDPVRIRFLRDNATSNDRSWLGIDDISISDPPAFVDILDHGIDPAAPREGDEVVFWADLDPSLGAEDIQATVEWEAPGNDGSLNLTLNESTGRYEAIIPGNVPALELITYDVIVTFTGFNADSPQTDSGSFFFLNALPESSFDTVEVKGDLQVPMDLVQNEDWIALEPVATAADLDVFFETENGGTTRWTDPDQFLTSLPIFGDLTDDPAADDINIDDAEEGWLLFQFNEEQARYNIQQAKYQDFEDWGSADSFGNHTIGDWTVTRGRATDDPALAHEGLSIQFEDTVDERAILAPDLPDGIGTVMFRYRNTATTLQDPANLEIQARADSSSSWITLEEKDNINTPEYTFVRFSLDRSTLTQLRIVVPDGSPAAQLLIDDIIITPPGPTVTTDDLTFSPLNPTILDKVDVSVTLNETLGASVTNATLWFRAGTNGVYDPTPMTNTTGDTYEGTIPRGPADTMQFYVEVTYFNPASGTFQTIRDPLDSTGSPESYEVTEVLAAEQNFDDFAQTSPPTTPPNVTENGWTINDIHVISPVPFPALSGDNPAFFPDQRDSGVSGTDSYITTPILTNGVGTISFYLRNWSGGGPYELQVEVSTDNGVTWEHIQTIDNTDADGWTEYVVPIEMYEPVRIRLLRDDAVTNNRSWLGIDDIRISYPPAAVEASDFQIHPAYPSQSEPVSIHATIETDTTFHKAINIEGTIEYQINNDGSWEEAPMQRYDDGLFIGQIPGYPNLTEVEYRIRSDFKGYNDGRTGSDKSPTTFTDTNFFYRVREFPSAYDRINLTIDGDPDIDLDLQDDGEWEGIITFIDPVSNPVFSFDGYGFYDGSSISEGLTTSWGDSSQTATNLPLFGTAVPGDFPITLPGEDLQGQFIFRLNEETGEYTVIRAVYQDFEDWPADNIFFGESYAAAVIDEVAEDFEEWPLNPLKIWTDNFDGGGWDEEDIEEYPDDWNITSSSTVGGENTNYRINEGGILVEQIESRGALLIPGGRIRNVDLPAVAVDVGTFEVDLRAANPNAFQPATYSGLSSSEQSLLVEVDMQTLEIPTNAALTEVGHTYKSLIFNYIDEENYYEARIAQRGPSSRRLELWTHKNGNSQRRRHSANLPGGGNEEDDTVGIVFHRDAESVIMRMYHDSGTPRAGEWEDDDPLAFSETIGVKSLDAGIALDEVRVFENEGANTEYDDTTTQLYSHNFSGGAGGWSGGGVWEVVDNTFQRPGYTGSPIEAHVEFNTDTGDNYTLVETITNITHASYQRYSVDLREPRDGFVRIRYHSTNPAGEYLIVGNLYKDGWRATDVEENDWDAQNVWVDTIGTEDDNENPTRAIEMRNSRVIGGSSGDPQQITSPELPGGASVISFDYRAAGDATGDVSFAVNYRTDSPAYNELTSVESHSSTNWAEGSFSFSVQDRAFAESIRGLRIVNTTEGDDDGLIIDNINITAPPPIDDTTWWGYNILVTDTKPDGIVDDQGSPWLFPQLNNEFGAFLNNSFTAGTDGATNDQFYPFIQSARMPDGIGEVRFQYRAWNETNATIQVVSSTNRFAPQGEWTQLDTLEVDSTEWQQYRNFVFDRENEYIAIRLNPTSGDQGRVSIDNVLLTAPIGADLQLQSIQTIPEVPQYFDDVDIQVEVADLFFNPTNIQLTVLHQTGTNDWGQYNDPHLIDMELVSTENDVLTYRTVTPIPAPNAVEEVIQYQIVATFDGMFAEESSPQNYRSFDTPDAYWPLDLNQDEPNPTPYYIALGSLPGQIWINEFNAAMDQFGSDPLLQYIEIAGVANNDISDWNVTVFNTDFTTNATYQLPPATTLGDNDGYGFFVLGNENTSERDMDLTTELPNSGGLQLSRPIGIIEQRLSYDSGAEGAGFTMSTTDSTFAYAGVNATFFENSPMYLTGTGSNVTDFAWEVGGGDHSHIGGVNQDQVLIPWPTGTNGPPVNGGYTGTVEIDEFWRNEGRLYATILTESEDLVPTPWYSTNLMENPINWQEAPDPSYTRSGTDYTVSFDPVEAPMVYYTISVIKEE